MDIDEDDDFYAPEENEQEPELQKADETSEVTAQADQADEDLEEGEEEDEVDEGSDSVWRCCERDEIVCSFSYRI